MGNTKISDMERSNKAAMLAHFFNALVVNIFSLYQVISGKSPAWLMIGMVLLGFIPVAGELYFWKKDHDTEMIMHFVGVGYAIFYTYIMFTTINQMVFVFVTPMILVISLFNDVKFSIKINIGAVAESILAVIIGYNTGKLGFTDVYSGVIQIVGMLLVGFYSIKIAGTSKHNADDKLSAILESETKTKEIMEEVSNLSDNLKIGISEVNEGVLHLKNATSTTVQAMQELSKGTSDTVNAVQEQIEETEAISKRVGVVDEVSMRITDSMEQTLQVLANGKSEIDLLVEEVEVSVQNGAGVAEKLKTLDSYIEEMHTIVELISGIASQTSLLALNASIEAARAGEAGRGFSVVATEISGMATQTNQATSNITQLIENVATAINDVVKVIYEMIEGINKEKETTISTSASFEEIQKNTYAIRDNVQELEENIQELKSANMKIVESIETISAVSEEATAHAEDTLVAETENSQILMNIDSRMKGLMKLIKE